MLLNSPDSINEAILPLVNLQSPERTDVKRHPSPYYYADLYKGKTNVSTAPPCNCPKSTPNLEPDVSTSSSLHSYNQQHQKLKYRKSCNFEKSEVEHGEESVLPVHSEAPTTVKYRKSSSLDTQSTDRNSGNYALNQNNEQDLVSMPPNRLVSPCSCLLSQDGVDEDDMTRQRHVYETAFDCRISKSDDDLDQIDKVTNHPVLVQLNTSAGSERKSSDNKSRALDQSSVSNEVLDISTSRNVRHRVPASPSRVSSIARRACVTLASSSVPCPSNNKVIDTVCKTMLDMHLSSATEEATTSLPHLLYTPSPPSTAPLPVKFHGKELGMNSIRSTPSLPSNQQQRLKDMRLPIKSLRGRTSSMMPEANKHDTTTSSSDQVNMLEFKTRLVCHSKSKDESLDTSKEQILEIKDRPHKDLVRYKRPKEGPSRDTVLEYKSCRRRHKYSSTESMTTSSSGGSMESLRSSTSEGNRSTTSSESRHSTSLSSHSSDSGGVGYLGHLTQTSSFLAHANKLHILSPISDKSSQEPVSETSDNNKNNNSQKCSPEEVSPPEPVSIPLSTSGNSVKNKRRLPQNKNLLNLAEIQGSDSGISIQSRDGVRSRFGFITELSAPNQDFSDLPFDMPKLRRRRLLQQQDACTSGSTTSVDLRDLPFDMPKLRRKLRVPQSSTESSVSQASSSQSVLDADKQGLY